MIASATAIAALGPVGFVLANSDPEWKGYMYSAHNVTLPRELPPKVAEASRATVAVYRAERTEEDATGTGVKIGKEQYLTAGHVTNITNETCVSIAALMRVPSGETAEHPIIAVANVNTNLQDLAVVRGDADTAVTKALPSADLLAESPRLQRGDVVYFTNYQSEEKDGARVFRHPHFEPDAATDNTPQDYGEQAAYPGVVLGYQPNGDLKVLTGGPRDYSKGAKGNTAQPRNSGGPVWLPDGNLYGLSVRRDAETMNELSVRYTLGIDIDGATHDMRFQVAYVQPVTEHSVDELWEQAKPTRAGCK